MTEATPDPEVQHFDGSALKKLPDGGYAISNTLEGDEELAPMSDPASALNTEATSTAEELPGNPDLPPDSSAALQGTPAGTPASEATPDSPTSSTAGTDAGSGGTSSTAPSEGKTGAQVVDPTAP